LNFFKTSGEDDEDDEEKEENWWLLDQVATLSHLVKTQQSDNGLIGQ
jgi:hypothetical protein